MHLLAKLDIFQTKENKTFIVLLQVDITKSIRALQINKKLFAFCFMCKIIAVFRTIIHIPVFWDKTHSVGM